MLDAGFEVSDAATFLMVIALVGFMGKLVFGFAADKMNLKLALGLVQLCVLVCFLLLASNPSYAVMMLAAVLMGMAAGGMLPIWGAMIARIFGLLSYGRAMGLMGPLMTLCVLPGYTIVGRMYDSSGSYSTVLYLFAGIMLLSIFLVVPLQLSED